MICQDASVVAKLVQYEERTDQAVALYREALLTGEPLVAPPLLPFDLTNIIRKQMRGIAAISLEDALQLLHDALSLEIQLLFPDDLPVPALTIADALSLSATYDAQYIALAEHLGCEFWTDDRRLVRQAGMTFPSVRWLGDFVG